MKNFTIRIILSSVLLLSAAAGAFAQARRITGTVSDSGGPIVGASVVIDGTSRGVTTNAKGEYAIQAFTGQSLVFNFMGYAEQKITVADQSRIDVVMEEESLQMEELVVVGYGTQRKSDVTGAVSSVKAADLVRSPASNVGDMLRGRAAGVDITSSSGRPGSAPNITIRGTRSLKGGNTPLIVIDGTPASNDEFNALNPADVASVEVLQDAASQAVYGARAANGVILVSTKKGEAGKTSISFNTYFSRQTLDRNFDFYNGEEFYQLRREAVAGDRGYLTAEEYAILTPEVVFGDETMTQQYLAGEFVNWEKMMLKSATAQNYDLSVTGGTEKLKAALMLGYVNQNGMVRTGSGFERGNVRLNMDYEAYKWLKIGVNASFSKAKSDREDGNFNEFITRSPISQVYDEEGNYTKFINSVNDINPLYRMEHYKRRIITDQYRLKGFIEIRPFSGFSYSLNATYYNRWGEDGTYKDQYYPGGGSSGSLSNSKIQNYVIENIVNYTVPFRNKDHSMQLTAVQSYDKDITKGMSYNADNVPVDRDWNMLPNGEVTSIGRSYEEVLLLSFMGRVQYGFKQRYLLTAAFRRDGSSKFGKNNKWGDFPSVSAAWRISEEPFMKDVEAISNLKLRLSWGQVGNQGGISPYTSIGLANAYDMLFGDNYIVGYLPGGQLPNPNLKWETTQSTNIGLDFGLLKNRLTGSVDLFFTNTTDLLISRTISGSLGYTSILDNLGETKTWGTTISLSGDIIRSNKVQWSASANFTLFRNEIVKINGERDSNGNYVNDVANNWFIGKPLDVYYRYQYDGIYKVEDLYDLGGGLWAPKETVDTDGDGYADTAVTPLGSVYPGAVRLKDLNGDHRIDAENDRDVIDKQPDFTASFSTTVNYMGFDLYADFYGVSGRKINNDYLWDYNHGGALNGKLNGMKVDYWTPENQDAEFPRPRHNNGISNHNALAIQDASYFRLRTLTLGYTLPASILQKAKIQRLRIYVTATNLFTVTDFKSYSPELTASSYPESKQWLFGLNFNF